MGPALEGMVASPLLWRQSCASCTETHPHHGEEGKEGGNEGGREGVVALPSEGGRDLDGDGSIGGYSVMTTKMELAPGKISRKLGK